MTSLHLVRHGRPSVEAGALPAQWRLDPGALPDIERLRLADVLPRLAWWVSSPEPKAYETARLLHGGDVPTDERLREQHRPAGLHADWPAPVERAFRSPDAPAAEGWEAAAATRERALAAARAALAAAPAGRDVVLVGHGTAWTLLVAAITGDPPDIVAWRRMTLPDHCLLDGERMVSPWGAWRRLSSA